MKRLNLLSGILMAVAMTLSFSACSDNNDPDPTPDPDPQPELSDYHFDIFMTIGKHGGMNQGDGTIVKSVNSLTADMGVIDIKNDGVEFRSENNTSPLGILHLVAAGYRPLDQNYHLALHLGLSHGHCRHLGNCRCMAQNTP